MRRASAPYVLRIEGLAAQLQEGVEGIVGDLFLSHSHEIDDREGLVVHQVLFVGVALELVGQAVGQDTQLHGGHGVVVTLELAPVGIG